MAKRKYWFAETREVNGAAAVDLLNEYLPLLREELGDSHV